MVSRSNRLFKGIGVAGVVLALGLTGCGSTGSGNSAADSMAEMEPITLTIADFDGANQTHTGPIADFAKAVTERTGGKVKFEEFYSASLIPANEMLSGIGSGVADMGRIVASYYPQELPINNWVLELGSTSSSSYPHGMLQGSATSFEVLTQNQEILDEYAENNLVPLIGINPSQEYDLLCTKPFETTDEAAGIRARTLGKIWVDEVSSMGLEPVSMGINEVYEGLQRGVIECATAPVNTFVDNSFWEVAKYFVPVSMSQLNSLTFTINKEKWDGLPAEVQEIMKDEAASAWQGMLDRQLAMNAKFAAEGPSKHGIEVVDPRELDKSLKEHQAEVLSKVADDAPAGVSDPAAFVANYKEEQEKWLNFIVEQQGIALNEKDPAHIFDSYESAEGMDLTQMRNALVESAQEK